MQSHGMPSWQLDQDSPKTTTCHSCFRTTNMRGLDSHDSLSPQVQTPSSFCTTPCVVQVHTSPVLLPEIIHIICSYLGTRDLAAVARLNRTWYAISVPLLYREITLGWRGFKIDSLELGVLRNGHLCRKLTTTREVVRSDLLFPLSLTHTHS